MTKCFEDVQSIKRKLVRYISFESIETLTIATTQELILRCMEFIDEFSNLSGGEKKEIVIEVVSSIVKQSSNDVFRDALLNTIDPCIELMISLSKSQWFINRPRSWWCS